MLWRSSSVISAESKAPMAWWGSNHGRVEAVSQLGRIEGDMMAENEHTDATLVHGADHHMPNGLALPLPTVFVLIASL